MDQTVKAPPNSHLVYRPEIDGLRAVAVSAVLIFHAYPSVMPGGFLGVDVFFVISGFLITSIILSQLRAGSFTLPSFWARRVRRIVPMMVVVACTTLGIGFAFGFRGLRPQFGAQGLAALTSVSNFYFLRQTGDYWGPDAATSPFLHTWSLAVEEQFYLVLPLTLFAIRKRLDTLFLPATLSIFVGSLGLFLLGVSRSPTATFYLLPTRAWELAAGAALAALQRTDASGSGADGPLASTGLCLILLSYVFVPALGSGVFLAVIGALLVLQFARVGISNKVLASRGVVYVGKISYSLYLWHWPCLLLPELLDQDVPKAISILGAVALAIASYHGVEVPTRRAARTVPWAIGGLAGAIAAAWLLWRADATYDVSRFHKVSYHGFYFDLKPQNFDSVRSEGVRAQMDLPPRQAAEDAFRSGGIIVGRSSSRPSLVVLGDSHGVMWSQVVRNVVESLGVTASFYSMDGVSPFFDVPPSKNQAVRFLDSGTKYEFDLARIEHIQAWHPDVVVLATRWSEVEDVRLVNRTLEFLTANAKQVVLIQQPPELYFGQRFAVEQLCYLGVAPNQAHPDIYLRTAREENVSRGRALVDTLASTHPNVRVVRVDDLYRKDETTLVVRDGNVVYLDDDHLTDYGSALAQERVAAAIREAYAESR